MNKEQYVGYLKYSGKSVEKGYLDARKASEALMGFDDALRYYVEKEIPEIKGHSYEIPVKIQPGSWEALIPECIGQMIVAGLGIVAVGYLTSAASTVAANDFKDKNIVDVFRGAVKYLQWIIKINKHLKKKPIKELKHVKWEDNNKTILLPDENGKYLKVPSEIIKKYETTPEKLLSKMANLIQNDRDMIIGVIEQGKKDEVEVNISEKYYFTDEESDLQEAILSELKHDDNVELEGWITKGNEKTNSIGIQYKGHILTCIPEEGSIVSYKETLFSECVITGTISRMTDEGQPNAKKPKIIFRDIKVVKNDEDNLKLF